LFGKVKRLSERLASALILLTFLQTVALLLDVPLKWPQELIDFIKAISIVNLNLELAKPECSIKLDYLARQRVTLLSPLVFFAFSLLFALTLLLKVVVQHMCKRGNLTLGQKLKARTKQLIAKSTGVLCTAFVVFSIFFLRTMVGGLDCSRDGDSASSRRFLDKEPQTACEWRQVEDCDEKAVVCDPDDLEYYGKVRMNSIIGLAMFAVLFVLLCLGMAFGKRETFNFLAEKMSPQWFWWELVLLARKLAVMSIALLTSENPEQGWFLCSFIVVIALSAHSFARPYKEGWLNAYEYSSLFSTLLLFQAGMVFKVDNRKQGSSNDGGMDTLDMLDMGGDVVTAPEGQSLVAAVDDGGLAENDTDVALALEDPEINQMETLKDLAKMLVWVAIILIGATAGLCLFVLVKFGCEKQKLYEERRRRQVAAERARSGLLQLQDGAVEITDAVSTEVLQNTLQARGAEIPEVEGKAAGGSGGTSTDAMLVELASRGVSVPHSGPGGAPLYVPPGMGGSRAASGQVFGGAAGQCRFCGRSWQGLESGASTAVARPATPGEIAKQGGDWRSAMQPKQREARQKYRELMKARNRGPPRRRAEMHKSKMIEAPSAPPDPPKTTMLDAGAEPIGDAATPTPTATATTATPVEPPPQPAPPHGAPPPEATPKPESAPAEKATKSDQQKAAQRAYRERMKAKGIQPRKSRGKRAAKKEPAKDKVVVMDYFQTEEDKQKDEEDTAAVKAAQDKGEAEPPSSDAAQPETAAEKKAREKKEAADAKKKAKEDAAAAKARAKEEKKQAAETKKRAKEEAKKSKKGGKTAKEALYADPEPELDDKKSAAP